MVLAKCRLGEFWTGCREAGDQRGCGCEFGVTADQELPSISWSICAEGHRARQALRRMGEAVLSRQLHSVEISVSSNAEERRKSSIVFLSVQFVLWQIYMEYLSLRLVSRTIAVTKADLITEHARCLEGNRTETMAPSPSRLPWELQGEPVQNIPKPHCTEARS